MIILKSLLFMLVSIAFHTCIAVNNGNDKDQATTPIILSLQQLVEENTISFFGLIGGALYGSSELYYIARNQQNHSWCEMAFTIPLWLCYGLGYGITLDMTFKALQLAAKIGTPSTTNDQALSVP